MKRIVTLLSVLLAATISQAQELYVFSDPASNAPANTLTPKIKAVAGKMEDGRTMQRYTPEVMVGLSPRLMLRGATTFSNMVTQNVRWEGAYLYGKYRFLSSDEVHRHFRMAAFAEVGYSRNNIMFDEVSVRGDNSGVDVGLIATQLVNKMAVSATASFTEVFKKDSDPDHHPLPKRAMNYSLSAGYLILPVEYKSYDQLNLNIYAELLGQRTFGKETWFIDAAPALQLIFNSNSKLNFGYRFQLNGNAMRSIEKGFLISFEHTFFNAIK